MEVSKDLDENLQVRGPKLSEAADKVPQTNPCREGPAESLEDCRSATLGRVTEKLQEAAKEGTKC